MQKRVRSALATPIIGRVIELNKFIITKSGQLHKKMQHNYAYGMLKVPELRNLPGKTKRASFLNMVALLAR